ncbi:MAG: ABC transporter permease [Ruminococcaceae bacterium]|nr:ABC transporter permease [Oscillospiraceae bacterium]
MKAIFKREMHAYFTSPLAYFLIGSFLALTGLNFWNMNLVNRSIEFTNTLNALSSFLPFFIPVITMKLLSEEKRNGTEVLLRTSAVKMRRVVLGKYFAAFCLFLLMVLFTVVCPIILSFNMNDGGVFPWAKTVGGYIGFLLLGCAYLSVGMLASSLSENQTLSAVIGMVVLLLLSFVENIGTQLGGTLGSILVWISLSSRYADFATGLFNLTSVVYYLSFTVVILFITVVNIERKRWN